MLDELHVENIALIEEARIAFAPGLTVLTGETGAGKTALLSALGLVRGQRADSAVVREGCAEALVEARIVAGVRGGLGDAAEHDDEHDDEHVLRRRLSSRGRSRCFVDGQMCTVGELAAATSSLRIHGQNESGRLLDARVQLAYLDAWIDAGETHLVAYRGALQRYKQAVRDVRAFEEASSRAERDREFMRYTLEQIERVNPQPGEYEALEEELPRLQHAEQLARAVDAATQALQADDAVLDMLGQASRGLGREAGIDPVLDELAQRLGDAEVLLSDLGRDLNDYASSLSFEPWRLEELLARLDELQGLMHRFGPTMDDVLSQAARARAAQDAAASSPEHERALRQALEQAEQACREEAAKLAALRHERALAFCEALAASVEELAMKGASFEFSFEELPIAEWDDAGSERIELLFSPSAASTARPLARIVSGGELSRVSLALECLHHKAGGSRSDETLVFDEIDAGVGGATGTAVAERLSQLARSVQVVVVTHLPQVAARADAHYVIEKRSVAGELPDTLVRPVEGDLRVREIARMLAGRLDATALEHARSLLEEAQR